MNERQTNKKTQNNIFKGIVCSNAGDHIAPVYKRVFDKDTGRNVVKEVDKTDIFEFIQASASSTDLAVLEKRFQETGEIPCNDPSLTFGVDTSNLPSDIHGVYNMVNNASASFEKLPDVVKEAFGSSEAYLESILKGTYQATLINILNNVKNDEKKEGNE